MLEMLNLRQIKTAKNFKLKVQKNNIAFLVSILVSLFSNPFSAEAVDLNKGEVDYNEVARIRSYPGGNQEEDLKVQEVLSEPIQTVYKSNVDEEIIKEFQKKKNSSSESSKDVGNN